ncbi:MAG: phytanoyl-CoA dioxygenase family protein [Capsulimonadales bacterium]|nr:phytanoyl-CoA dioxygenase family protein [Capsulimonadales bacterium]
MIPVITEEQKAQLREKGFFVLENVFTTEEMNALADRIEAHQRRHQEDLKAHGGASGISRAEEITFTSHLAEQDEEIRAFVTRPEFVKITTDLLGPDIDLYWNQAVFKMPEGEKEFPWHQDDGYTPVEPSPYLTLWLALNDATVENGCVWVLPESHKNGLVEHVGSPLGFVCHSSDDPNQGVPVPVKAGSLAVFYSLTMHKSGVNRSKGPRKAFIIQYSQSPLTNLRSGELVRNEIPLTRNGQPV